MSDPVLLAAAVAYVVGVLHAATVLLVYERGRARGRVEALEGSQ